MIYSPQKGFGDRVEGESAQSALESEASILREFDSRRDLGPIVGLSRRQILDRARLLLGKDFTDREVQVITRHGDSVRRPI